MADPIDQYLDAVLLRAYLPRQRARVVRAELKDHLTALVEESGLSNPTEIRTMLEEQFGAPAKIGNSLRPTYRHRTLKKWLVRGAVAAALFMGVRATVAEVFYAVTDAAAPMVPAGSRCLVFKRTTTYMPGDVIAFRHDPDHTWLGVIKSIDEPTATITIARKDHPDLAVSRWQLVGRVIANTR